MANGKWFTRLIFGIIMLYFFSLLCICLFERESYIQDNRGLMAQMEYNTESGSGLVWPCSGCVFCNGVFDLLFNDMLMFYWTQCLLRFGEEVMDTIVSWTKNLCIKTETDDVSEELSSWNVLDIGTGNGLLLQALAKQGYAILAI
jgi:hypothetical protein